MIMIRSASALKDLHLGIYAFVNYKWDNSLMQIFYITANNGDGSSSTEFYDSKECIDYLTDDDKCDERYMDGDGGSWGSFTIHCGEMVPKITGIEIGTISSIKAEEEFYED